MPSGIFSQPAKIPMTFIGKFMAATECITPKTPAAPPMSYFISSIASEGLIDIPPESKVKPLPTKTIGG